METQDPFDERVSYSQAEQLRLMSNFWGLLPELLKTLIVEYPLTMELLSIATRLDEQAQEAMSWFEKDSKKPITVSLYYKLLFFMRDATQPLMVELENVAKGLGHDIKVPVKDGDEVIAIQLSEWIPKRLLPNA